jgi:hypothetical protein
MGVALEENVDSALKYLEEAIAVDKNVLRWARHDIAWKNLRENTHFQSLTYEPSDK